MDLPDVMLLLLNSRNLVKKDFWYFCLGLRCIQIFSITRTSKNLVCNYAFWHITWLSCWSFAVRPPPYSSYKATITRPVARKGNKHENKLRLDRKKLKTVCLKSARSYITDQTEGEFHIVKSHPMGPPVLRTLFLSYWQLYIIERISKPWSNSQLFPFFPFKIQPTPSVPKVNAFRPTRLPNQWLLLL